MEVEITIASTPDREPVFFSYAHADRDRAKAIVGALQQAGFSVWWDEDLQLGSAYNESIQSALENASAVIVLWSETSTHSHWVRDEAELGRERGVLVPLVVGGIQPPLGFRQLQAIDLDAWNGKADHPVFQRLLHALNSGLGIPDTMAPLVGHGGIPAKARSFSLDRRTLVIGGGGIATLGILGFLGLHFSGSDSAAAGLAVLPFRNLTGDPQKDYLSAGLSEELRAMLSRNQALRIVARASCEAMAERGLEAVAMASQLSVSHLLDGSLRKTQSGLAIAVELINGETGFTDWSQDFVGTAEQILAVQRGIIDAVTQALTLEYRQSAEDQAGSTANAAAFDAYLQANALFLAAVSVETDLAALSLYDRAISLDPDFGAARAARARILVALGNTSSDIQAAQNYYEAAAQSARAAVAAAPSSADTQSTLGLVLFQAQLKVAEAREPYEQSYRLGQGSAAIVGRYGAFAAQTGLHEIAAVALASAQSLDPLNPTVVRSAGFARYAAGDYQGANDLVSEALVLNPELGDSHARIGMGLILLGKPQEAIEIAAQESFALVRETCLAIAHHQLGNIVAAENARAALVDQYGDASMYQQAQILAAWGQEDKAMEALAKAWDLRDSGLTYLNMDPFLQPLRNRPEFLELLSTLGYD